MEFVAQAHSGEQPVLVVIVAERQMAPVMVTELEQLTVVAERLAAKEAAPAKMPAAPARLRTATRQPELHASSVPVESRP